MSVRFFTCKNCKETSSEYNEIICEKCESSLCGCTIPAELEDYIDCWDQTWHYIDSDENDNIKLWLTLLARIVKIKSVVPFSTILEISMPQKREEVHEGFYNFPCLFLTFSIAISSMSSI